MERRVAIAVIIYLAFALGCARLRPAPPSPISEMPQAGPEPFLTVEFLDGRIQHLDRMATNGALPKQQRELAGRLAGSYRLIRTTSVLSRSEAGDSRIVQELLKSLHLLEEQCLTQKPATSFPETAPLSLPQYLERRNAVLEAYLQDDFGKVVRLTRDLIADYGSEALTGKVGMAYVLSLARHDMVEEAISTAKKLEDCRDSQIDRILLKTRIAQWQLETGLREEAEAAYSDLSRSLQEWEQATADLRREIAEIPEKLPGKSKKMPQSVSSAPARHGTLSTVLSRVDELVEEERFDDAREALLSARRNASSIADALTIGRALADVDASEESYLKERIALIGKKKEALELTEKLIEQEKYDQAVATLDALEAEQGQAPEIEALRRQAVEKHIHQERNRAARLYLLARQNKDTDKKLEYLRSSRAILQSLLEKYPASSFNAKIQSNIEVIQNEIRKLGVE